LRRPGRKFAGIGEVGSSAVLDTAFAWLCKRRVDYADNEASGLPKNSKYRS